MSDDIIFSRDLAGIEVGETHISDVRGEEGLLSYRGYSIESLATKPFWQVVWLVLFGAWPDGAQEKTLSEFMAVHSQLTPEELNLLAALPRSLHPMLMLQGMGVYRLDDQWYPVQAGDVIWMAPYCPQWFIAGGNASSGCSNDTGRFGNLEI